MIKGKIISATMSLIGVIMVSLALVLEKSDDKVLLNYEIDNVNNVNMSSSNRIVKTKIEEDSANKMNVVQEISMEQAPQSVYIPPRIEVYEGMTIEELGAKLDKNLGTGVLAGKGVVIATKCIELGVDPYVATAIMLHETGCRFRCSTLARMCNNVGGQKGGPRCGNGSYKAYSTIDEGIHGHIENLYKRYYAYGLNTVELIGPKYAESNAWIPKINWYVNLIRTS